LNLPPHRAEIVYEPYEELEVVAFCLPTNPLARKKLTLKELVECPLVMRSGGRTEKMFTNLGYKVNIALRCEVSSAVRAAVRIGMGVGILYRNAVASRVARGNLSLINVPELKEMGFKSFIIYDRRKPSRRWRRNFFRFFTKRKAYRLPLTTSEFKLEAPGAYRSTSRLLKISVCRLLKKTSEARRA
jgi:DNA-binding transcriptional LysR family regulator